MKLKTTLTMLSAVIALGMPATNANSQTHFSGPRNMGATINSADDDQGGAIAPSGLSLYFTSNRPGGQGGQDIYVSQRTRLGSDWGAPQNLGALNSEGNELAPSFSLDGRTMFFTSNRTTGGMGNNDIYLSTRTDANNDFGWSAAVNLGAAINTQFSERGATYFEDPAAGNGTLIFAREFDPTSMPFHDLYQSTRNTDGTFNAPTLINELNTIGSEIRATHRIDGLEVFIHTARPGGLGAPPPAPATFDIFVSTRASTSAPWNPPVLVAGLNTTFTEGGPALSPDGSVLYLQSNRPGGFGGNDLYSATRCSLYSATPCTVNRTISDFNADGISDISVFRPSEGNWYIMESGTNTFRAEHFGLNGDKIVPGDYDGDALIDLAVFRPSTGIWWIQPSSNPSNVLTTHWGLPTDKPAPGDYDGDGRTDLAVYRDGTWYIVHSSTGQIVYSRWGLPNDIPIAGSNTQ